MSEEERPWEVLVRLGDLGGAILALLKTRNPLTIEEVRDTLRAWGEQDFAINPLLVGARGLSPEMVEALQALWQGQDSSSVDFEFSGCSLCSEGGVEHFVGPVLLHFG